MQIKEADRTISSLWSCQDGWRTWRSSRNDGKLWDVVREANEFYRSLFDFQCEEHNRLIPYATIQFSIEKFWNHGRSRWWFCFKTNVVCSTLLPSTCTSGVHSIICCLVEVLHWFKVIFLSKTHEVKRVILHKVRFNPCEVRLVQMSHQKWNSSLLDISICAIAVM